MGGDDIFKSKELLHCRFEVKPVIAPRVGFIPKHQPGPLLVAHGICAAVGKQVYIDIPRLQQEGIEARFLDPPGPLFSRQQGDGLNHFDFVWFR